MGVDAVHPMDSREDESLIWDDLFRRGEIHWRRPHEAVVQLSDRLKEKGFRDALDLGCGLGRHLVYLAQVGFEVHGADLSGEALRRAHEWLRDEGFVARLTRCDFACLPYRDSSFDAVVSLYVLYHGVFDTMRTAFREVYRVLRPGGLGLVSLISDRHYRRGSGVEVEAGTYIPDVGIDAGLPHHFSTREEIGMLVRDCTILRLDLEEQEEEGGSRRSHWLLLFEKPVCSEVDDGSVLGADR